MTDPTGALVAVATLGLGEAGAPPEPVTPEPAVAADLVDAVAEHRIAGVAVRALEAGELQLPDEAARRLIDAHDAAMARTLIVEARMLDVAEALDRAAIDHRILKGSALAHLVASDPSDREFRDVDVLVRSHDMTRAVRELETQGARRVQPSLGADFDRRFAKSVTLRWSGVEVDVHRTVAAGPFGVWSMPDDLFVLPATFSVAGTTLTTLDSTDHLLHGCYHVALGQALPALANLRDIALLAGGDWDDERFKETIERWRGRAVVARACRLVQGLLGVDLGERLARYAPRPGDGALLEPYSGSGNRFPALAWATLRALPARDRAAFARAVALPPGSRPARRVLDLWASRPQG